MIQASSTSPTSRAERAQARAERDRIARSRTFGDDLSDLYGSAKLLKAGGGDISQLAAPGGAVAAPLGRDPNAATGLVWDLQRLQGHSVTFGATRSGKGVASIIPTLLSYSGSMIVIDPKGENAWATMDRRKAMGQRVVILDPWGEVQRRYGDKATPPVQIETTRFNPLAAIEPTSEDFADDVTAIADALVVPGLGEAHWTDSARELIGGLVALACERYPGVASLGIVRRMVASSAAKLVEVIEKTAEANPDALSTLKLARFTETGNEVNSVRAVANTQTAILDSRRLEDSLASEENPLNLADLGTSRVTLYLVLPLDRLETHGRWLRLIITMAIRAIAKLDRQPSAPVYFCLDEAGTIGALRMVEQAFGLMAGVGIRISLYLQDIVQLQKDYPKSWETFISNSSVVQALKVTDLTTSEYLSKLMGTTTRQRISGETMQLRQKRGGANVSTGGDVMHSRALMMPQEIRDNIGPRRVLVILPGVGNYLLQRMPYFAPDSIWRGMYRSPPWFAADNANAKATLDIGDSEDMLPPGRPAPASPGNRVDAIKAWFLGLSTAGKAGVGAGGLVVLYLVAHLL